MGWTSNQVKNNPLFPSSPRSLTKSALFKILTLKFGGQTQISKLFLSFFLRIPWWKTWVPGLWAVAYHPACSLLWEAIPAKMTGCLEDPIALLSLIWSFICVEFARRMLVMNEISVRSHNCPPKLLFHLFWKCVKFYNTMHSFEKSCKWEIAVFQLWRWMDQMKGPVYWSIMPVAYILCPMKQFLGFVLSANCLCVLCV